MTYMIYVLMQWEKNINDLNVFGSTHIPLHLATAYTFMLILLDSTQSLISTNIKYNILFFI